MYNLCLFRFCQVVHKYYMVYRCTIQQWQIFTEMTLVTWINCTIKRVVSEMQDVKKYIIKLLFAYSSPHIMPFYFWNIYHRGTYK